jgi:transposase
MAFEGACQMSEHGRKQRSSAAKENSFNALEKERKKHNGKRYDREFKVAAVKLVTEKRYTAKQAALSLGVKPSTLQYWVKIYGQGPRQQAETMETLRMKNKQLEAENQRLKLEREILKKATAFFASQQP